MQKPGPLPGFLPWILDKCWWEKEKKKRRRKQKNPHYKRVRLPHRHPESGRNNAPVGKGRKLRSGSSTHPLPFTPHPHPEFPGEGSWGRAKNTPDPWAPEGRRLRLRADPEAPDKWLPATLLSTCSLAASRREPRAAAPRALQHQLWGWHPPKCSQAYGHKVL